MSAASAFNRSYSICAGVDDAELRVGVRKVNGGVFLGLNGIVIKSHGGTDALGFASAIDVGYDMARNGLTQKIENDLKKYHARHPSSAGPEAA
mgnify:CR=1 FL=1